MYAVVLTRMFCCSLGAGLVDVQDCPLRARSVSRCLRLQPHRRLLGQVTYITKYTHQPYTSNGYLTCPWTCEISQAVSYN